MQKRAYLPINFESDIANNTGLIPIPDTNNETLLGGHELCLIGFDDSKELFIVMNSWGSSWGDKGFCYIPYSYLLNKLLGLQFTVIYL
jgi:C1A family cysteine protease